MHVHMYTVRSVAKANNWLVLVAVTTLFTGNSSRVVGWRVKLAS